MTTTDKLIGGFFLSLCLGAAVAALAYIKLRDALEVFFLLPEREPPRVRRPQGGRLCGSNMRSAQSFPA